ncbi:LysR substrate-binding domain-containing protein [Salinarimonas chemoclinalis]|uniref:LysR substrate-binding domain-containing protein n=1 Tax=Salinarimonas chemoclinalis TaxID=3241599 RepID=UPI003558C0C9
MNWSDLPPLSMLRAFEAAARHRGFSAAGRELNVTHSAIAQQVRGLEERLGVALMRREGRGLALTPDGARLAGTLREALDLMREGVGALVAGAAERPVQVTTTTGFAAGFLAPRLGAFRYEHPEIELMINPSAKTIDLARSDFDLAVRYGDGGWEGVESEPLLESAKVVVAAPALIEAGAVREPRDLLRYPWIQELGLGEWQAWLAAQGIAIGQKRDIHHLPGHMAIAALRDGQGIGLTARMLVEADLAAGRLVVLFDDVSVTREAGYWLVRRPGRLRPSAAAFADWLRREAHAQAAKTSGERNTGGGQS